MKTLASLISRYESKMPLASIQMLACTHETEATAGLLKGLLQLGARVSFLPIAYSGEEGALHDLELLDQFQSIDPDHEERIVQAALESDIIIEDGAVISKLLDNTGQHLNTKDTCVFIEQTTQGIRYHQVVRGEGSLPYPIVNVAESVLKLQIENARATPEAIITTLLTATRASLVSKNVLVLGYGYVGSGIANLCRAHGGIVTVCDSRASKRLLSEAEGFRTCSANEFQQLLPDQDIIICCTPNAKGIMLGFQELLLLKDGAMICNSGSGTGEIAPDILETGVTEFHNYRVRIGAVDEHLRLQIEHKLLDEDKTVLILSRGYPINLHTGSGTSTEVMDVVFSLILLATIHCKRSDLIVGLNHVSRDILDEVAQISSPNIEPPLTHLLRGEQLSFAPTAYGGVMKLGLPGEHMSNFSLARARFDSGKKTVGHYHIRSEEAYLVESGAADMTIWHYCNADDKAVLEMRSGDYLTIPPGHVHHVRVTSPDPFVCLVIASPPFSFWDQFFPDE